jgi:hypothetical protein
VTVANRRELWYVPPAAHGPADPVLLTTFAQSAMAIVEAAPDVFYIATSPVIEYQAAILAGREYSAHESYLHRLDLRGWTPSQPVKPEVVLQFPESARGLNGGCVIAPGTVFIADCFAGLIWRVDLSANGKRPRHGSGSSMNE